MRVNLDAKVVRFNFLVLSFFAAAICARSAHSYWSLAEAAGFGVAPDVTFLKTYIPPARKAILIDPQGLAHRTADNTALTYRDRSRLVLVPYYRGGKDAALFVRPNVQKDVVSDVIVNERTKAPRPSGLRASKITVLTPERASAPAQAASEAAPAGPAPSTEESDAALAARVRSAVLADDALYITGMNLQVTASDGVVTLSGPVNSPAEKERIGDIAKKIAGRRQVYNRLNVLVA